MKPNADFPTTGCRKERSLMAKNEVFELPSQENMQTDLVHR